MVAPKYVPGKGQWQADVLASALAYARRGWPIVACYSVSSSSAAGDRCFCDKGKSCEHPGKHPRYDAKLLPHGINSASADERLVRAWLEKWPLSNLALRTGAESGLLVLDLDEHDPERSGSSSLRALVEAHGPLPNTLYALTGGGGTHIYFRHPGGEVKSREVAPGLELRGDGGQVTLPPSRHISGLLYAWGKREDGGRFEILPPPAWLLELHARAGSAAASASSSGGLAKPSGWIAQLLGELGPGNRNDSLLRIAGGLRARGLEAEDLLALLEPHAAGCKLPPDELRTIVRSVCRYPPRERPEGAPPPRPRSISVDVEPPARERAATSANGHRAAALAEAPPISAYEGGSGENDDEGVPW